MGLPSTMGGIVGFLIFVVLIIGMSANDLYPDETENVRLDQQEFRDSLNLTVNTSVNPPGFWNSLFGVFGLDGIYNFLIGVFGMVLSFIGLLMSLFLSFFGITTTLPGEFLVLFLVVGASTIIAIIKLLFLAGD